MDDKLPELQNFILPGGDPLGAVLHRVRTVCRRTERVAVSYQKSPAVAQYLNRLSDFLFVAARYVNDVLDAPEQKWVSELR